MMLASRQKAIGLEPAAAMRELGVDRGDAMLVVASGHQLLEQTCHTSAGPGPSTRPGALLFGQCLGLAFHEQQVIHQHPQGRVMLREHAGTAQSSVQLVDEISVYLIDTRKRSGGGHTQSVHDTSHPAPQPQAEVTSQAQSRAVISAPGSAVSDPVICDVL
ncbi:hypothetical protein [Streptomyces sp. NPDC059063]|uniref:hypothetical protein n=1 Tax=unclassified Streptomyces TaxID=2593676 RepID=UPI0036852DBC